jgi:hypothetical protein
LFKKSRTTAVAALALSLAVTGIAVAGDTPGTELNEAEVVGSVKPSKLPKKDFKPVSLFLGVVNSPDSTGNPDGNAAAENISISKNVKVNLSKTPLCPVELTNGTPTETAIATCEAGAGEGSMIGQGVAEVHAPGAAAACNDPSDPEPEPPCVVAEPVVTVFHGPTVNKLQLHTYSPALGASSPVVDSFIVDSTVNGYGKALDVPVAPVTGALKITGFNATIAKSTKVAKAKCDPKKIKFLREVTYKDGPPASSETATKVQNCTVKN